ncbi:MAG: c-type cytochrome, partial [Polyangiales bacterium]
SREPASLWIATVDAPSADDAGVGSDVAVVNLGGDSVYDTGHELFHRAPGAGLACASCHGEGAEDGHVWVFSGQGQRRTQAVHIGLAGTEPFHWDGELADMGALMEEVMVSRMGGVHQSIDRGNALQDWLFSIKAPAPLRLAGDASALRGKQLFEGTGGCTQCHSGAKLTNNQTIDVGTGKAFQVPSLVGVGHRGPWLHDGCAKTLQERFDPLCGGSNHGQVAQLAAPQIDDLVAYLETL